MFLMILAAFSLLNVLPIDSSVPFLLLLSGLNMLLTGLDKSTTKGLKIYSLITAGFASFRR